MSAHKPRSGSLAYYPRVRAARHMANFYTFPETTLKMLKEARPLNFIGYKAGMLTVFGKNAHDKSHSFGQETAIPATVIECPPVKVIGVRAYIKDAYGMHALGEVTIDKPDRNLRRKIKAFKMKGKAHGKAKAEGAKEHKDKNAKGRPDEGKAYSTFEGLEKDRGKFAEVVLIVQTQPGLTGIGKKKADVAELHLSGNAERQLAYAKEKLGKELRVSEVFEQGQFVDVKAVDKGKGFQGVVKRFGVKIHRPKAKKRRYVGSIGPWHPPLVQWTVAMAGQMGYQTRTEYNKRVLLLYGAANSGAVNPAGGFQHYGLVKNDFIAVHGSVPGAPKRPVALRIPTRMHDEHKAKFADIKLPSAFMQPAERAGTKGLSKGDNAQGTVTAASGGASSSEGRAGAGPSQSAAAQKVTA